MEFQVGFLGLWTNLRSLFKFSVIPSLSESIHQKKHRLNFIDIIYEEKHDNAINNWSKCIQEDKTTLGPHFGTFHT